MFRRLRPHGGELDGICICRGAPQGSENVEAMEGIGGEYKWKEEFKDVAGGRDDWVGDEMGVADGAGRTEEGIE